MAGRRALLAGAGGGRRRLVGLGAGHPGPGGGFSGGAVAVTAPTLCVGARKVSPSFPRSAWELEG
ncbi:MAG TPA: hypothetical protein ENJ31_11780 [Anaerolineae bacterium]|nr:hypothetical protein [Anaerolineae bacterium]